MGDRTPLVQLKGVGEKTAKLFSKLHIDTVEDLLSYYPRDYETFQDCITIAEAQTGQTQAIYGTAADTQNVGDHDGDMSETKLTERQQKILNLIKESPTITGKQMSETLSVSQRTIERDLSALQKKGVLKREGKDNDGLWIVLY